MNQLRLLLDKPQHLLLLAIGLLLLPALTTNLGLLALYGDESIRALVALEMDISGNYLTPTMFGEFYYNKPPLYNWILLAIFKLTGRNDEFIARFTTVLFLLAYAATVFFVVKKQLARSSNGLATSPAFMALLVALGLVTCGRILFWDSMLALIDTCFSLVIYAMLMTIFAQGEQGRYGRLFAGAYLLAAIGFLLKGLPAVVFLGISLLAYFFWCKKWRPFFSLRHVGGMAVFGAVVGSYYALYAQQNGLEKVFTTLFNESAKRTFVEHGIGKTILHFFTFPFEMWYHFLPWTLLAVYFFRKKALAHILGNRFVTWNALACVTTVLPYWASVEVYPRYLLMHVPMVFTVLFYLHFIHKEQGSKAVKWLETTLQGLTWLMLAASFAPLFWKEVQDFPHLYIKVGFLAAATGLLLWGYRRWEAQRFLAFVAVLLVARIGFDWFVLPTRYHVDFNNEVRRTSVEAVEKADGRPIHIYKHSLDVQPVTGYYFTRETGDILRKKLVGDFSKDDFYILDTNRYHREYETISTLKIMWEHDEILFVKIK